MCAQSLQSCPTLCDPIDCSPRGSSVLGISQARRLECVTISFHRGSSQPRNQTRVSYTVGEFFTTKPQANRGDIRDKGSVPGSGRSPGGGHGNPLQYSCLENPRTEEPGGLESLGSQRVGHDWNDLACMHAGKPHFTPEIFNNPFCFHSQILSTFKGTQQLDFPSERVRN